MGKMDFKCTKCSLCCYLIKTYKEDIDIFPEWVQELIKDFHYEYDKDTGRCEMLQDDNTCKVYEQRPTLCNLERAYHIVHLNFRSKKDWFIQNNRQCNRMIIAAGLDIKYLIDLKIYDKSK